MKLVILLVAMLLVLGGGGGAGYYFFVVAPAAEEEAAASAEAEALRAPKTAGYVEMEPVTAPVWRRNRISHYFFIALSLEVTDSENVKMVRKMLPRLRDAFVRELHSRSVLLKGGAETLDMMGIKARLREQAAKVLGPGMISEVLITKAVKGVS